MTSRYASASGRTAVFTIVSKNYLHFARVLMRSLERTCPSYDRFLLLADEAGAYFDQAAEPFETVELRTLPLPEPDKFTFRYTILELNTAVKPWFFRDLFARGYRNVVYLDPDIEMYAAMTEVDRALDGGALAVLVPHLTGRLDDGKHPGELDILQSGSYNLGFCALGRHADLDRLLDFWCEKSVDQFVVDLQRGLFTDQRWIDLVPGMFPDVEILRHEGYDVAYWNLPHRQLTRRDGHVLVNELALVFFHFSGFDPLKPEAFSKHQNRYRTATAGIAGELAREYGALLRADGAETCSEWPYAYGFLRDGSPIPDVLRQLYRTTPEVEAWAGGDPFARACEEWNEPLDEREPRLTRVMLAAYRARADLRLTWPDIIGQDREPFVRWFVDSPDAGRGIPPCYIDPVRGELSQRRVREQLAPARATPPTAVTTGLVTGAVRKAYIAAAEGRLPLSPSRWWQLYRLHVRERDQEVLRRGAPPLPAVAWPVPSSGGDVAVTVVGYLADGTGVSTAAHASALACEAAGISHEIVDARPLKHMRGKAEISLLHVNADQTPIVASLLGPEFFRDRFTIGVWLWELEDFPDRFDEAFSSVDEIWAPSAFVHTAIAARSPVPVVHMPLAVVAQPTPGLDRAFFGLPSNRFLFVMMYDVLSIQARKNPLGALAAFRRAFPHGADAGIVVRVNHASQRLTDVAEVRAAVAETPGAILIDQPMARNDALALQQACDAFVSLHRSEGFGLNIAEAMLLKKPVIATAWSGNMDFTTPMNSCLVDAPLVALTSDHGPYPRGSRWADPDVDHAAHWMRALVDDADLRDRVAMRGHETIVTEFSPTAVGAKYFRRLEMIRRLRARPVRRTL